MDLVFLVFINLIFSNFNVDSTAVGVAEKLEKVN